jgi:hypothetical protein
MMGRPDASRARRPGVAQRMRATPAVQVIGMLCLALGGCASWQQPGEFDDSALQARVESQTVMGVELRAAVLSRDDSRRMFGVRVNESGVQPVWIEVNNTTEHTLWLLRSGTDPDLFSPLEVAWSFHTRFASESNSRLDAHFDRLNFQNPIPPGATRSGIIFTNPHDQTRLLNVDILGQGKVFPFTLFLAVPDDQKDKSAAMLATLFQRFETAADDYRDVDAFRARLRQLPCCASTASSDVGGPLNVILVGEFTDLVSAFVRRGFRLDLRDFHNNQQLFGRLPDLAIRKAGQARVPANWLRLWLAPFRFEGQPVFVVQTARRQGWRSTNIDEPNVLTSPQVDEVRDALVQDMAYSGGLEKIAFDTGAGAAQADTSRSRAGDARYQTDGLRAVMFFITRPLSLADIEFLDWLPLDRLREIEPGGKQVNGGN